MAKLLCLKKDALYLNVDEIVSVYERNGQATVQMSSGEKFDTGMSLKEVLKEIK